ncbi:hypothetical protein LguiB_000692 [Lonicera macranthoides]
MAVLYFAAASSSCTKIISIVLLLVLELLQISSLSSVNNEKSSCNLFMGSWVYDTTYPMYNSSACSIIDQQFNCQFFARPDSDYLKYRWKPSDCQLPRFNGLDFLLKMRGKTVMFVGDSLGRNQWQSLICLTSTSVPGSPTQMITRDPLSTFKFLEYGVSLSFYRAPYLVDIDSVQGKNVLRLDYISGDTWRDVDVLSFNTGDNMVDEDKNLPQPSEWSTGTATMAKSCYGEMVPASGTTYPGVYTDPQYKVLQRVISDMNNPAYFLDITMLSALRKDAHPSIYGSNWTPAQKANPDHYADCSHWCLPGLPDIWNQLFYAALLF